MHSVVTVMLLVLPLPPIVKVHRVEDTPMHEISKSIGHLQRKDQYLSKKRL